MADEIRMNFAPTSPEGKRLAEIFGVTGDELVKRARAMAEAAREEYRLWYSGERNPGTITELRELRLKLLYEYLPEGEPTDDQIAQLFQITRPRVGTLIANTHARFGTTLEQRMRRAAVDALTQHAYGIDDDTIRVELADSLGRYVKELAARRNVPPVEKSREASRTYEIRRETVIALCSQLEIDPEQVTALDWTGS